MPHHLTHVVIVATLATTAVWDRPAFAADAWWGSASCTADATSNTTNYANHETHKWEIVIPQVITSSGSIPLYAENWTVTGKGSNDINSWTTDGGRPGGSLAFRIGPDGLLHIGRFTAGIPDPQGTNVTPKSGGNSFHTAVNEIGFPNIPPADPKSTSIVDNPPPTTTPNTTGNFFLAPTDSTVVTTCSWNFQYGPPPVIFPSPGSVTIRDPRPVEDSKPTPGGIKPLVPATLSIFFGGPGGGSVAAPTEFTCFSDCTPPVRLSEGQTITLTAIPDTTSIFAGWGGPSCSGASAICSVTLGASNRVIAYFRSKFKTVAAGAYHTCALRPAGDVVCWGYNAEGEIGTGTPSPPLPPSPVTSITSAVAIAAGGHHTCALLVGGTVTCWGKGNDGQLGDAMHFPASSATPMTVPDISEAVAVTAGGAHTCVVHAGGSASCWGLNGANQLGASSTPSYHSPTPVSVARGAIGPLTKQIAAGAYHTCAIVTDSTVFCWGSNSDGQLGTGMKGAAGNVQIDPPGCSGGSGCADITTLNKVTSIAASIGIGQLLGGPPLGGYHTVALDGSGMDWGWGNNNDGQLFAGPGGGFFVAMKDSSPPGPMPIKIAAGAYHTCILVGPAGVFCRGNNNNNQSGPTPPDIVPMTASAVDVGAGGYHTCAVIVDVPSTPAEGSVACWGLNWNGEVDGTFHGSNVTTPVLLTVP